MGPRLQPVGTWGGIPGDAGEGCWFSLCWGHEVPGSPSPRSCVGRGRCTETLVVSRGITGEFINLKAAACDYEAEGSASWFWDHFVEVFQEIKVCREPGIWVCLAPRPALDSHGIVLKSTCPTRPKLPVLVGFVLPCLITNPVVFECLLPAPVP